MAAQYDEQRRKLIPCFDDFYSVAVSLTNKEKEGLSLLDLGAGTGLFSSFFLEKHPKSKLTLIDLSEKMLAVAQQRLNSFPHITYIVEDYTKFEYKEKYDLVISCLSIHHLTDVEKKELYQTIFSLLNENGLFINADQVLGDTPRIDELYKKDWKDKVESSGLSRYELESAYERTKLDKMSTLDEQITWLKEVGFSDADCIYKYFNFVVMAGWK